MSDTLKYNTGWEVWYTEKGTGVRKTSQIIEEDYPHPVLRLVNNAVVRDNDATLVIVIPSAKVPAPVQEVLKLQDNPNLVPALLSNGAVTIANKITGACLTSRISEVHEADMVWDPRTDLWYEGKPDLIESDTEYFVGSTDVGEVADVDDIVREY